ncbi:MAG: hypothetical protein FGM61_06135 [Sediminibacterium sp.]|nr:hypothetical protein [Sediminibacterium sp.]
MSNTKVLRSFDDIRPTHNYVRFAPQNLEQLNELVTIGFELFDVPLTYEVLEEGDFYQDPSIPANEITYQYTLVPYGFPIPSNIPYVILDEIFLFNEEEGESQQPDYWSTAIDGVNLGGRQSRGNQSLSSLSTLDDYIGMYGDPVINATNYLLDHQLNPMQVYEIAILLERPPLDMIGIRDYPDDGGGAGGGSGGGGGGITPSLPGYPSGVLRVRNTEMPDIEEPVKKVTVKARKFLKLEITQTDYNGRFQMKKKFRNRATIIVKFQNELASIRRVDNIFLAFNVFPVKHNLGRWGNDNMNNIQYTFATTGNGTSDRQSEKVWAAATAMNALIDTYEFNRENGINCPPHLNIWLNRSSIFSWASSPMLDYILNTNYGSTPLAVGWKLFDYIFINIGPIGIGAEVLKQIFNLNRPDVIMSYGSDNGKFELSSEKFYSVLMHEFSHSTHYWGLYEQNGASGSQYWVNDIQYTVEQNGYGNRNDAGAERAGVIEAWGFFVGDFSFAQKYRRGIYTNDPRAQRLAKRAIIRLDNHQFSTDISWEIIGKGTDNNYYYGWIPMGFLNDLNDNVETGIQLDNVSGYDVNRIFRSLQNLNNTADDLRTSLINNRPSGVTRGDVEGLARQFGY